MNQHSLSTSNSKNAEAFSRRQIRGGLRVLVMTLVALVIIDAVVNVLFPVELRESSGARAKMANYFSYGYSIERKLEELIAQEDKVGALVQVGWNDLDWEKAYNRPVGTQKSIVAFGQSFTNHVMREVEKIDGNVNFAISRIAGPGAPLGHSYQMFLNSLDHIRADYVVIGILASAFPALDTLTYFTWNTEAPAPYTYPKWYVQDGQLRSIDSYFKSYAAFKENFRKTQEWDQWLEELQKHDGFYNSLLTKETVGDSFASFRLAARAYAQGYKRRMNAKYYNPESGFNSRSGIVQTAHLILEDIQKRCREAGCKPVVLLFNNLGYDTHLYQALGPKLDELGMLYVSSHVFAPVKDVSNFLPDGHFTPKVDRKLAEELLSLLAD